MSGKRILACIACSGAIAAICWDHVLDGRLVALPHDPTLATTPVEAAWAFFAWPFTQLLKRLPLEVWESSLVFSAFALCIGIVASTRTQETRWATLHLLAFVFASWVLIRAIGSRALYSGPDAFAFTLVLLTYSLADSQRRRTVRFLAVFSGLLASFGSLYLLLLAKPFRVVNKDSLDRVAAAFFSIAASSITLACVLVRYRYPNPLVPPSGPVWLEWWRSWFLGNSIEGGASGSTPSNLLFGFPGMGLLLAWVGGLAFARFCRFLWRLSAGRTVPAQLVLLSPPVVVLIAGTLAALQFPDSPSLDKRLRNARTLIQMVPPRTTVFASSDLFGIGAVLQTTEESREDVAFRRATRDVWAHQVERDSSGLRKTERHPTGYSTGENWIQMAGEEISFAPHYLLNATTEVFSATPFFFIGNDPASATGKAVLLLDGFPFDANSSPDLGIQDCGYNGEHFLLFRTRTKDPWLPLGGDWAVEYLGFMLSHDIARWGEYRPPRSRMGAEGLYR